jgi:hypothetical protein
LLESAAYHARSNLFSFYLLRSQLDQVEGGTLGYDPAPLFGGPEEFSFEEVRLQKAMKVKLVAKPVTQQAPESAARKASASSQLEGQNGDYNVEVAFHDAFEGMSVFDYGAKRSKIEAAPISQPVPQPVPQPSFADVPNTPVFTQPSVFKQQPRAVAPVIPLQTPVQVPHQTVFPSHSKIAPSSVLQPTTPSAITGPSPTITTKEAMNDIMAMFGWFTLALLFFIHIQRPHCSHSDTNGVKVG